MFDDTYRRIPSEGWMFLPLVIYHGGGPAAQFEPLNLHRTEYDFAFAQYFGAGVQGKTILQLPYSRYYKTLSNRRPS